MPESDSNYHIEALEALSAECSPLELATSFKDQGNERLQLAQAKTTPEFERPRYRNEAIYFYTKALDVKCPDMKANAIFLANRAAVYIEQKNYGKAVKDCQIAIEMNEEYMKAYYRMLRALIALDRNAEAIKIGDRALEHAPEDKEIAALRQQAVAVIERKEKRERELREAVERKKNELETLAKKLRTKKMTLGTPLFNMAQYTQSSERTITFELDTFASDGRVGDGHFPTVFLYPEYNQSDFIVDFQEGYSFGDHLAYMFPPENKDYALWDIERKYTVDKIEIYFQTNWTKPVLEDTPVSTKGKRWVRVKHTTNIEAVLAHPEYIIAGLPLFYVISKGSKFANKFLTSDLS
eukprot:gene14911-17631_t